MTAGGQQRRQEELEEALRAAARAIAFSYGGTRPEQFEDPEDRALCEAMHRAYAVLKRADAGTARSVMCWLDEHRPLGFRLGRAVLCRLGQHDPWCRGRANLRHRQLMRGRWR